MIPTPLREEQKWKMLNFTEAFLTLESPFLPCHLAGTTFLWKCSFRQAVAGPSGSDTSTVLPSVSDARAQERREERRGGDTKSGAMF